MIPGKQALPALAFALGLAALTVPSPAGAAMTQAEILALFPGTFVAIWKDKKSAVVEATVDGILRGETPSGWTDEGRWWFEGRELCVSFNWWTFNKAKCGTIDKKGAWYVGFYRDNGSPRVRFKKQ